MSQILVTGEAKIRDIQGPVVANSGVITALDGAASQYVRGDGTLADFPTSTGGGSSVSYYLNGSVNQGTFSGSTYYEMNKSPIIGAGTDFPVSTNGLVAQFITDANDPDLLEVPGGNFNLEFYFSVNNNTGNPTVYAELYKYDGTTFTLLGSSQAIPESINQGTTIAPYYFAIPVGTAALNNTDRIAIRIYANVDGRTVTLHTENSHLCQVVTTFSKGMVSLNNLTDQSQFITTGTSGTNFAIVSSGDTHTFNLPVASATNTGKLSNTDWSTFNSKQPAGNYVTLDTTQTISGLKTFSAASVNIAPTSGDGGILNLKRGAYTGGINDYTSLISQGDNFGIASLTSSSNRSILFDFASITSGILRTYTLPNLSGTLALLEGSQTFTGYKTFDAALELKFNIIPTPSSVGNSGIGSNGLGITITTKPVSAVYNNNLYFASASNTFTFPNASGTIALTSDLGAYVPYTGATANVDLGGFSLYFNNGQAIFGKNFAGSTAYALIGLNPSNKVSIDTSALGVVFGGTIGNGTYTYTLPSATGTLALTSNLSAYVPYTGATGAVNLGTNELTSGNAKINDTLYLKVATTYAHVSGYYGIQVGTNLFTINNSASTQAAFSLASLTTSRTFTLPDSNGTLALTSNLSAYLPLSGGTLTGALSGTSATFSGSVGIGITPSLPLYVKQVSSDGYAFGIESSADDTKLVIGKRASGFAISATYGSTGSYQPLSLYTSDTPRLTIATNGAATFSSSVTATQGNFNQTATSGFAVTMRNRNATQTWAQVVDVNAVDDKYFGLFDVTNSAYRMVVTNGGNVGIGTSSPGTKLDVNGIIKTNAYVNVNDGTSDIYLRSNADFGLGALPAIQVASNSPLQFATNNTLRMVITSGGQTQVKGGTANYTSSLAITNATSQPAGVDIGFTAVAPNNTTNAFLYCYDSSVACYTIWSNGTTSGRSDARLKKNIAKASSKIDDLMKLDVVNYEWNDSIEGIKEIGLIAQNVEEIFPSLVVNGKEDEDGNSYKQVKYSVLPIINTKAIQDLYLLIQEQQAQIEELKAKIK